MKGYWASAKAIERKRMDRWLQTVTAIVDLEPRRKARRKAGRARHHSESIAFRNAVREAVDLRSEHWPKPRAQVAVDLRFTAAEHQPPPLWELPKNYLDLLGATSAPVDDPGPLVFKDDVQVKLLFASLHRGRGGNKAGRISLVARTRTSAIEDMQLAGQLLKDDDELGDTEAAPTVAIENDYDHFAPGVAARLRQLDKFEHQAFVLGSNDRLIQHVLFQSARWLLTGVDTAINRMERLGGGLPRVEDIVNEMAEQNAVDRDLLWSTVRIELPALPLLPGDSERFKEGVRDAFRRFADETPNLSPVLVPLRVTVLVIPPVRPLAGAKDLDNILITVMQDRAERVAIGSPSMPIR